MTDEGKLRKIYGVVNDGWKLFKKYTGAPNNDTKWSSIHAEAERIWREKAGEDAQAKYILFGFVEALEVEGRDVREHGRSD